MLKSLIARQRRAMTPLLALLICLVSLGALAHDIPADVRLNAFIKPEGNRIELFVQTPWYMPPVSVPLDFALSDDEMYVVTEAMVQATPGSMNRAEWRSRLQQRLSQEGTIEHRPLLPD